LGNWRYRPFWIVHLNRHRRQAPGGALLATPSARQAESASTTDGRQTRKGAHKRLPSNMPESRIAALFVGQYLWTMVNNFSSHVFVRNSSD
jgi:hypothetical protein